MKRVTGIGGVFFKAQDSKALGAWYEKHLGMKIEHGCVVFKWAEGRTEEKPGSTVWSAFSAETKYFEPSRKDFIINYRVENLERLLKVLAEEGVTIDPKQENSEYGKFAWIMDPEGNRLELWEPPAGS